MVVAQFWHATTTVVLCSWAVGEETSVAESLDAGGRSWGRARQAVFETLLLKAGQPLQPAAPPVPLQRPPPGQEPDGARSAAT